MDPDASSSSYIMFLYTPLVRRASVFCVAELHKLRALVAPIPNQGSSVSCHDRINVGTPNS